MGWSLCFVGGKYLCAPQYRIFEKFKNVDFPISFTFSKTVFRNKNMFLSYHDISLCGDFNYTIYME